MNFKKGTLIRIFNAFDGEYLHEVRRGTKNSEIYSICFNSNSHFLACSSDRGTVHVFSLRAVHKKIKDKESTQIIDSLKPPKNPKSL